MSNELEQFSAYIAVLVRNAGGKVEIPFEEVNEVLPEGFGTRVYPDQKREMLVFEIVEGEK